MKMQSKSFEIFGNHQTSAAAPAGFKFFWVCGNESPKVSYKIEIKSKAVGVSLGLLTPASGQRPSSLRKFKRKLTMGMTDSIQT